jgi:hypothetical protein
MQTIEFLGIPGSGKTTLAAAVVTRLQESGNPAFTLKEAVSKAMREGVGDRFVDPVMARLPKGLLARYSESGFIRSNAMLVSLIDFMTARPGAVAAFLEGQARRADYEVGTDLVIRWFLQLVARYQLATSALGEADVLILDEGFAQRAVTGFAHRFSAEDHPDIDRYLGAVPRPALLVHLDVPVDVAATRVTEDGQVDPTKRLWGSDVDPVGFLEDARDCVRHVAGRVVTTGWEVLRAQGPKGVTDHISMVMTRLGSLS